MKNIKGKMLHSLSALFAQLYYERWWHCWAIKAKITNSPGSGKNCVSPFDPLEEFSAPLLQSQGTCEWVWMTVEFKVKYVCKGGPATKKGEIKHLISLHLGWGQLLHSLLRDLICLWDSWDLKLVISHAWHLWISTIFLNAAFSGKMKKGTMEKPCYVKKTTSERRKKLSIKWGWHSTAHKEGRCCFQIAAWHLLLWLTQSTLHYKGNETLTALWDLN